MKRVNKCLFKPQTYNNSPVLQQCCSIFRLVLTINMEQLMCQNIEDGKVSYIMDSFLYAKDFRVIYHFKIVRIFFYLQAGGLCFSLTGNSKISKGNITDLWRLF